MFVSSSLAALVAAGTVLAATPPGFEPASREDLQVAFCDNLATNGAEVRQDEMEMSPVLGTGEPLPGNYAVVLIDTPTCAPGAQPTSAYLRLMQTGLTSSHQVSSVAFQDIFELENTNDVAPLASFVQPNSQTSSQYTALLLNTTGCGMRLAALESSSRDRENFNIARLVQESGATVVAASYFKGSVSPDSSLKAKAGGRKGQRPINKRNQIITDLVQQTPTPIPVAPGQQAPPVQNLPPIIVPPGGKLPNQPNNVQPGQPNNVQPGQPAQFQSSTSVFKGVQPTPFPQQPGQLPQQPGQQFPQQPGQQVPPQQGQPFPQQPGQPVRQQPGLPAIILPPGATPISTQTVIVGQPGQPQFGQPGQPQFTLPPGAVQPTGGQQIPGFRTPITSFTTPFVAPVPGATGVPGAIVGNPGRVVQAPGASGTLPAILQPNPNAPQPTNGIVPGTGNGLPENSLIGNPTATIPGAGQQTNGLPVRSGATVATARSGWKRMVALTGLSALVAALMF